MRVVALLLGLLGVLAIAGKLPADTMMLSHESAPRTAVIDRYDRTPDGKGAFAARIAAGDPESHPVEDGWLNFITFHPAEVPIAQSTGRLAKVMTTDGRLIEAATIEAFRRDPSGDFFIVRPPGALPGERVRNLMLDRVASIDFANPGVYTPPAPPPAPFAAAADAPPPFPPADAGTPPPFPPADAAAALDAELDIGTAAGAAPPDEMTEGTSIGEEAVDRYISRRERKRARTWAILTKGLEYESIFAKGFYYIGLLSLGFGSLWLTGISMTNEDGSKRGFFGRMFFVFTNFREAMMPLGVQVGGIVLMVLAAVIG